MLQAWPGFPRSLVAGVACAALLTAGCTMCPDPYDYSGPVPNGSTPQNDFRARSNGILPIGAAPQPYPAVVKATPHPVPEAAPIVKQPVVEQPVVAEAEDDVLRLTAEVPVIPEVDADDEAALETVATVEKAAAPKTDAVLEPASEAESASPGADTVPVVVPQPVPVASEPPLRETPGWRTRR